MPRRKSGQRAIGPYPDRDGWRVVEIQAGGARKSVVYRDYKTAVICRDEYNSVNPSRVKTVEEALEEYGQHYLHVQGNKPNSWSETKRRILTLLPPDTSLESITNRRATKAYETYAASGVAVDTHRGVLAHTKTFMGWCAKKHYVEHNPFVGVSGIGKKKRGKMQLRRDEARRWVQIAYGLAVGGEWRALMAMLTLLLGQRISEIVNIRVRDIDDGAKLLVIPDSKTYAGIRTLQIPSVLQELLKTHAAGRDGDEYLFACRGHSFVNLWVGYICHMAGVPRVTAHGMRGLHASLGHEQGAMSHVVVGSLGHESFSTSSTHYISTQAKLNAKQRAVEEVFPANHSAKPSADEE